MTDPPTRNATMSDPVSTNPKDAIGSHKLPLHLWPAEATALGCLSMLEGDEKYGRNNMIAGDGVICSIYVDAAMRHLQAFFSGEDFAPDVVDPETGEPLMDHLGSVLACAAILVKARAHGKLIDDRDFTPKPGAYRQFIDTITKRVTGIKRAFADKHPRRWTIKDVK